MMTKEKIKYKRGKHPDTRKKMEYKDKDIMVRLIEFAEWHTIQFLEMNHRYGENHWIKRFSDFFPELKEDLEYLKEKLTPKTKEDNDKSDIVYGKVFEITLSKKAEEELKEIKEKICKNCPLKPECTGKCLIRC